MNKQPTNRQPQKIMQLTLAAITAMSTGYYCAPSAVAIENPVKTDSPDKTDNPDKDAALKTDALNSPFFHPPQIALSQSGESGSNSQVFPKQILKTGVSLNASTVSPNTAQLAKNIGLTPVLEKIQSLQGQGDTNSRLDIWEAKQKASLLIQKTNLDIDFTIAEIQAEEQLYAEILSTFTGDRDKTLARVNAASFISNGILWAVAEAIDIPTYRAPRLAIPSGTVGIIAGVVPSLASMYTLKAVNGKKKDSEAEPNMLAKLFGYPVNADIDYPPSVWSYLHEAPASDPQSKTRLNQLIDRWIGDSNIPSFTDRSSKAQLDVITASVSQHKGLSISTLSARTNMLQQLRAEVYKMKRLLLELDMAMLGEKQI